MRGIKRHKSKQIGHQAKEPLIIEGTWERIEAKVLPPLKKAASYWPWWVLAPLMLMAAIGHPGH